MPVGVVVGGFFFFSSRRRHTRLQGDWSSDVCSSDLHYFRARVGGACTVRRVSEKRGLLRLPSGVGLVAANMIGAGVFISAGFMSLDMTPGGLLLARGVGAVLALPRARADASGGELVAESRGRDPHLP